MERPLHPWIPACAGMTDGCAKVSHAGMAKRKPGKEKLARLMAQVRASTRREPEKEPLYQILAEHLETFLQQAHTSEHRLPLHVEKEMRAYLRGTRRSAFATRPARCGHRGTYGALVLRFARLFAACSDADRGLGPARARTLMPLPGPTGPGRRAPPRSLGVGGPARPRVYHRPQRLPGLWRSPADHRRPDRSSLDPTLPGGRRAAAESPAEGSTTARVRMRPLTFLSGSLPVTAAGPGASSRASSSTALDPIRAHRLPNPTASPAQRPANDHQRACPASCVGSAH